MAGSSSQVSQETTLRDARGVRSRFILSRYREIETRAFNDQGPGRPGPVSQISSIEGGIRRIFLALPWWLFQAEQDQDGAVGKHVAVLQALLETLPSETEFVILVNQANRSTLEAWLDLAQARERSKVIEAPDDRRYTLWAEDAFSICRGGSKSATEIVTSPRAKTADDGEIGDLVAQALGFGLRSVPFILGGGNALVGDDFWLIGADYPDVSVLRGYITPGAGEPARESAAAVYSTALDTVRRLIPVASRIQVPGFDDCYLEREIELGGEPWTEVIHRGNADYTVQPLYHIDLFLSLAGRGDDGRFVVLVGDPRLAAELLELPLPAHALAEVFDDIAAQLAAVADFTVIRNPLPLVYVDDADERLREWYFATSNNVLVQDRPAREVWLPGYGHPPWPELAATDRANAAIWRGLGYRVHVLPDCHPLAYSLGGPHCIKKYLSRAL